MISFTKSTLDMNKLHMLLLERRALIIQDFLKSKTSNQNFQNFKLDFDGDSIVLSCSSSANLLNIYRLLEVSDYKILNFDLAGNLSLIWSNASSNLTVQDLLKFGVLDESKVSTNRRSLML